MKKRKKKEKRAENAYFGQTDRPANLASCQRFQLFIFVVKNHFLRHNFEIECRVLGPKLFSLVSPQPNEDSNNAFIPQIDFYLCVVKETYTHSFGPFNPLLRMSTSCHVSQARLCSYFLMEL